MKMLKRNQIVIAVIGLMLITAGYLNFSNNSNTNNLIETGALADSEKMASIGDAQLVSTTPAEENIVGNNIENKSNKDTQEYEVTLEMAEQGERQEEKTTSEEEKETKKVNSQETTTNQYFTQSRLDRDSMYSQMIESYQKILEKTNVSEKQRTTATQEIKRLNEQKNALMIAENLIKTKGFEDVIIFINDSSISVIIKSKKLKQEEIAQIQNIITRELNSNIENIHISNKE